MAASQNFNLQDLSLPLLAVWGSKYSDRSPLGGKKAGKMDRPPATLSAFLSCHSGERSGSVVWCAQHWERTCLQSGQRMLLAGITYLAVETQANVQCKALQANWSGASI